MRSLRLKIALILIGSIVAVLIVAAGVTAFFLSQGEADRMIQPWAHTIAEVSDVPTEVPGQRRPDRPRQVISDTPATGTPVPGLTAALTSALAADQASGTVIVTTDPTTQEPVASYQLSDGRWMILDFPRPMPTPPQVWFGLGLLVTLFMIGVVVVALMMARRAMRPFVLLEQAVASVGPDGILPLMPESGSAEERQTAASLNRLSARLKASMESRMRLIAAAGHDFRTPMTRMRLRAEFLPDEERESWLSDLAELESIADSAIRLVREESAGEDQQPIAVDGLVADTVNELSAAHLPVQLTASSRATVTAGPLSLKRALRNLIINAATHGGGARVALEVSDQNAKIEIDDDGPGIPPEMMDHIFEPFFRATPGRAQITKGAGLGLAIAKEIIERLGGSIDIVNRSEGGVRQTVRLRLATA